MSPVAGRGVAAPPWGPTHAGGVSEARMAKLRTSAARGWPPGWGPPLGWLAAQGAGPDADALALARETQAAVSSRRMSAREGAAHLASFLRRKARGCIMLCASAIWCGLMWCSRHAGRAVVSPELCRRLEGLLGMHHTVPVLVV